MISIALCGYARCGKDTAAQYLLNKKIVERRYSFADPLKEMVNTLFKWDERHSDGELKERDCLVNVSLIDIHNFIFIYQNKYELHKKYPNVSVFKIIDKFFELLEMKYNDEKMVYVGSFSPRKAYQLFGTEVCRYILHDDIWLSLTPDSSIVIADVRFPNEYEYLKNKNIPIIKINNLKNETKVREHISEKYISEFDCDYEIDNDMTDNFFKNLDIVIKETLKV